jgi:alpha-tubulin suppressor-like RCC1 family protein
MNNGEVRCWGWNGDGQLGVAITTPFTFEPQTVTGLPFAATAVSSGAYHTCALLTDGTVWCWGRGNDGQLGTGYADPSVTPAETRGVSAIAISASGISACAVLDTKAVSCWGKVMNPDEYENDAGGSCLSPGLVTGASKAAAVSAGDRSCAVTQDGSILCWGWESSMYSSIFTATATPVPGW